MTEQTELNKMNGLSLDLAKVNLEKLKAIFPDCVSQEPNGTERIDVDKILALCGQENDSNEDLEKYSFTWHGKAQSLRIAQRQSSATLRPCEKESVNFEDTQNLYIEGDNLEVLKLLQKSYFGKVKMIYIDPPYNTGNDFIYEDDFKEPLERYKEITSQTTKSNPETMGRFHTNWLNMMYPRLRLAANLLSEDGAIFISIDDMEQSNLKKICDEIFGEENFIADFIWKKKQGGGNDSTCVVSEHEYVICYAKSLSNTIFYLDKNYPLDLNLYPRKDELGRSFGLVTLDKASIQFSPSLVFDIQGPDGKIYKPRIVKGKQSCWRWSKEKVQKEYSSLVFENDKVYTRFYKPEGVKPRSLLVDAVYGRTETGNDDIKELFNEKKPFSYPKPVVLIKHFLSLLTSKNDLILDFFSGSATTAHAVMQLNAEDGGNRKFIMIQIPALCDEKSEAYKEGYKNICEIGKERIRRAGKLINAKLVNEAKEPIDIGFKVLKLDTSNIVTWDSSIIDENNLKELKDRMSKQIYGLKDDRSSLDLIYEILLKMGYEISLPIKEISIEDITIFSVENNELLICLDQGVTPNEVEKMLDLKPQQIVIAESSFIDNSALSNAYYFCKNQNVELKLI